MSSNYISLYIKNRCRFEIMLAKLNPFIRKVSRADRALANNYSALKEDACSIIGVMESHGRRLSENDLAYYVERLKNIVSFFEREMKTEKDYFSDEKKPTAADKIGQVAAKLAALFEATPTTELDDENDTQTDEGAPISDDDLTLPPGVEEKPANLWLGWDKLTWEERRRVKDSVALFYRLDDITAQDDESLAAPILTLADSPHTLLRHYIRFATAQSILAEERELRRLLWKAIDAIPDFRDSEEFKTIIERFPTYKHLQ